MAKLKGSAWCDGNTFHYCDSTNSEWFFTGALTGVTNPSAIPGSMWCEGSNVHYIDSAHAVRAVPAVVVAARSGVGAVSGSTWIQQTANANYSFHFIEASGSKNEMAAHADVALVAHTDIPAVHNDGVVHTDGHADQHNDSHSDSHSDTAHADGHSDSHNDVHTDSHADDHGDYHGDHGDVAEVHNDGHGDEGFGPDHNDQHNDGILVNHTDTHDDFLGSGGIYHGDIHDDSTNVSHTDTHSDSHTDVGHNDSHNDIGHNDTHQDVHDDSVGHNDSTTSHTDVAGVPHSDQPTLVGP